MQGKPGQNRFIKYFLPVAVCCALALVLGIGAGSVHIPPADVLSILKHAWGGAPLPSHIDPNMASVLVRIRIPRALCAFLVGGMLSAAGVVMQAVLQNPLASSYTLGVSSGASLGAALVVVSEISIPFIGAFVLPVTGFAFGFLTVLFVLAFAARLDRSLSGHTVILLGMVVSLFMNAMLTLVNSLNSEHLNRILMWQMGSFSGRRWYHAGVLCVCSVIVVPLLVRFRRELDIITFGDEQALAIGVNTARVKKITLAFASLLTGVAVCFTGTIGFVDLIVPHVVRRVYGPSHGKVLVLSYFYGGAFMAVADTVARTILSPREIPVGAVTALVGTPFFIYLYFFGKSRHGASS